MDSRLPPELLTEALRGAWTGITSIDTGWSEDRPWLGQCAVTALVVQDHFGGSLIRAEVDAHGHYWNLLPDGSDLDLTRDQFETFEPTNISIVDRDYVTQVPDTLARYHHLARSVTDLLAKMRTQGS